MLMKTDDKKIVDQMLDAAQKAGADCADVSFIRGHGLDVQVRLGQVESALVRLRRGEYGICELTGEEIPIERLRANPLATRTIEAQERAERRSRLFAV